jgi:hypothetical protein
MQKIILFFMLCVALFCYADSGKKNKGYQACLVACEPPVACGSRDDNNRVQSFSNQVACSNRQLDCKFACKDKYNVE